MGRIKNCILFTLVLCASPPLLAQDSTAAKPNAGKVAKALAAPSILLVAGAFSNQYKYRVRDERNRDQPNFHTAVDNYLQYAPIVVACGLKWAGIKSKNDLANQTALLIKSELLMTGLVESLKYSTQVLRPDGSNRHSFPSGHTAQAFAAAAFLQKEYGHISIWYSIGGYTAASAVGALRILNNKHWISDVLVGAGIGVLSTNLVYLTHQYRWGKNKRKSQVFLSPTYGRGPGIYFCYQFK